MLTIQKKNSMDAYVLRLRHIPSVILAVKNTERAWSLQPKVQSQLWPPNPPILVFQFLNSTLMSTNLSTDEPSNEKSDPSCTPLTHHSLSLGHEILFVSVICTSQLMTQAALQQGIAPAHYISLSFPPISSPGELSWYAAAYSLTVGTFILPAGRFGDVYGHRRMYIIGWSWFALWSLLAGLSVYSRSQIFFDVCRACQGIGPAILIPNGLALLGREYPDGKRKHMAFSLFGATAPIGAIIGSAFASIFAQLVEWQWTFYVCAIACVAFAMASAIIVPAAGEKEYSTIEPGQLDLIGSTLGVVALVLINFAWNQGPTVGWGTSYTYSLLLVGLLVLGGFFYWEWAEASHPLLALQGFSAEMGLVLGCIALGWSSFGIWLFYLYQFLLLLREETPLLVTAQFSPVCISGSIAAISTGLLLDKVGPGLLMLVAMTAFCLGNILASTAPVSQIYWLQTFVGIFLTPFGMVGLFGKESIRRS